MRPNRKRKLLWSSTSLLWFFVLIAKVKLAECDINQTTIRNRGQEDFHLTQNLVSSINPNRLRKCCQHDYILRNDPHHGLSCIKSPKSLNESSVKNIPARKLNKEFKLEYDSSSVHMPKCENLPNFKPRILNNRNGIWFEVYPKDEKTEIRIGIDYFLWAAWIPINQSSYCLDMDLTAWACQSKSQTNLDLKQFSDDFRDNKNNQFASANLQNCNEDPVLLFCELDKDVLFEFTIHRYIFGLSSLATCVPIVITLVLYFHLNIHHNLRKWILISYFASYCLACAVHGTQILLFINSLDQEATVWCKLFNDIFLYLSCVFGTACMFVSLDIFWCFWKMNSHLGIINPSRWGIITVLILTWVAPLIIYIAGEFWREYFAHRPPDLAWKKCMSLNLNTVEFLIMIQFAFKFSIYLSTSLFIYRHKKSTSFATPGAQSDFNESKVLYLKLFVTTGMPFTCLVLDYCFAAEDPMNWWWFIIRFPHSAIGLYIFIVFGLSREVRIKWARSGNWQDKDLKGLKNSNISEESHSDDVPSRMTMIRRWRGGGMGVRKASSASLWTVINSVRNSRLSHRISSNSVKSNNNVDRFCGTDVISRAQ